jgi:hypothetical protein
VEVVVDVEQTIVPLQRAPQLSVHVFPLQVPAEQSQEIHVDVVGAVEVLVEEDVELAEQQHCPVKSAHPCASARKNPTQQVGIE